MSRSTQIFLVWVAIVMLAIGGALVGFGFLSSPAMTQIDPGFAGFSGTIYGLLLLGAGLHLTYRIESSE